MVKNREASIIEAVKEREHTQSNRDKARAEMVKAQDALREHERVLVATF